ncbi:hypothetical protein ACJJTC_010907 [Scirpophaga incertulas]
MVQGGDIINGDGSGGESIYGATFEDENFELLHSAGVLSMANKGKPHTNGSQFCITTVDCPQLDGTNVVFGQVLAGLAIVCEMQESSEDGKPKVECTIADCGEVCGLEAEWGLCSACDRLPEHPADLPHLPALTVEELVSNMKITKLSGNNYFGQGRYKGAARKYRKCLRYIDYARGEIVALKNDTLQETLSEVVAKHRLHCYLNLAATYMKLEDYASCVKCCSEVLEIDERNEKALYRRGQANFILKNYDAALSDLKHAERVSPANKAIQKLLEQVRQCIKSYNDVQKQRLSKFFREQTDAETIEKNHADCDD